MLRNLSKKYCTKLSSSLFKGFLSFILKVNSFDVRPNIEVTLDIIKPPIWRRIQIVEKATFWDLHCAIQDAIGWWDCHLHKFRIGQRPNDIEIGIPDDDFPFKIDVLPGWDEYISDWFNLGSDKKVKYMYDFGDGWEHTILLEKILPRKENIKYINQAMLL